MRETDRNCPTHKERMALRQFADQLNLVSKRMDKLSFAYRTYADAPDTADFEGLDSNIIFHENVLTNEKKELERLQDKLANL